LETLRWVYNETLAVRKNSWVQEKKSITYNQTSKLLTQWKKQNTELFKVHSQVLRDPQVRVDIAFQAFFRRVKAGDKKVGYPRFKGYGRYNSLTFTQYGYNVLNNGIKLTNIGIVKVSMHRKVEGKIHTITVKKTTTGKFFVSIVAEIEPKPLTVKDNNIGIDVGLESFATLSNGEKIANPRFYRNEEAALIKAQRKLSAEKKGSLQWRRRLKVVQRVHERIGNKRSNFVHQESRKLVNTYGVIAFENLDVKNMQSNHRLAKSIGDASWNMFINATKFKAEEAGSKVVLVNPRGTSQKCSNCGLTVKKDLSVRIHKCECGLVLDRDLNASINILRLGLQSVGLQPLKPINLNNGSNHLLQIKNPFSYSTEANTQEKVL